MGLMYKAVPQHIMMSLISLYGSPDFVRNFGKSAQSIVVSSLDGNVPLGTFKAAAEAEAAKQPKPSEKEPKATNPKPTTRATNPKRKATGKNRPPLLLPLKKCLM
jgi:hypothetical protein